MEDQETQPDMPNEDPPASPEQLSSDLKAIRNVLEESDRDKNPHRTIIAASNLFFGFVFLIAVPAILLVIGVVGVAAEPHAEEVSPTLIVGTVGFFAILILAVLSAPFFLAGWGLFKRKSWGNVAAIVAGVFHLANIPLGTVLAIYTFWAVAKNRL